MDDVIEPEETRALAHPRARGVAAPSASSARGASTGTSRCDARIAHAGGAPSGRPARRPDVGADRPGRRGGRGRRADPSRPPTARAGAARACRDDRGRRTRTTAPRGRPAVFSKVMVANRGEIAIRVFRTLREMGIALRGRLQRGRPRRALRAPRRRGVPARARGRRRELPRRRRASSRSRAAAGAEAVHPGYGFLAENAGFARGAATAPGSSWIGPPPDAIDAMGRKIGARAQLMDDGRRADRARASPSRWPTRPRRAPIAERIGYPVAVKAAAGGGGKGFRVVARRRPSSSDALRGRAARGRALLRRRRGLPRALPPDPRHVEIQILGRRARQRACTWASATARSSAATRSWSRRRPRPVGGRRAAARAWARPSVRAAQAVGYIIGRHGRVPASIGRGVLLPRDEHPPPGGAHGHRGRHRARPGARAGARGGRRAARRSPRTRSRRAATPSSAASTPRTPRGASSPPPPASRATASPRARGCAWTRGCARGPPSPRSTTRWSPS